MRPKRTRGVATWILLTIAMCAGLPVFGQESNTETELLQLRSELKRIEARIDALEAAQSVSRPGISDTPQKSETASGAADSPSHTDPGTGANIATGPAAVKQAADKGMDTMDAGMGGDTIKIPFIPQMKIRGFGDVRAFLANQNLAVLENNPGSPLPAAQGGNSTFALGLTDLFVTSKISERFSYLAEIGFEADPASNGIGVDLERAQVTFRHGEEFSLSAGRTHAMLGYYNTAFHHGTWFQTTIDRPRIFEFEDSGGPLPIHNVGVASMGKIPVKGIGLHWLAELGNGKQTYSLFASTTPANVLADHTGKSTNIGMFIRPDRPDGLQAGFNWYQASLVPIVSLLPGFGTSGFPFPNAAPYYKQNIFVAHAVYIKPSFELMAEDAEIRDLPRGASQPLYTSGGYVQLSKAFGVIRPYARYQWMNPNFKDPNNAWVGRWVGPTTGMRWDINTFVALKLEYSHFDWKNFSADAAGTQLLPILHKTVDQLGSQLTYTF